MWFVVVGDRTSMTRLWVQHTLLLCNTDMPIHATLWNVAALVHASPWHCCFLIKEHLINARRHVFHLGISLPINLMHNLHL